MSNNISINPVTAKLLSGELKLSEITLEQFREGRIIYNSYKEAKCKGYEAHHIVPRSCQEELLDDRCIRYTSFEHLVDHYLMGRENEKYIFIFECMTRHFFYRLNNNEQEVMNNCIEFSKLREEGFKKISESNKGRHWYTNGYEDTLSFICPEGWYKGSSKRKGISPPNKGVECPESRKIKISNSKKGSHWYTNGVIDIQSKQCPDGFWTGSTYRKGKTPWNKGIPMTIDQKEKMIKSRKGYKWFNDGYSSVYCRNCPAGYIEGRLDSPCKGLHWYNNGVSEIRCKECPVGFKKGRLLNRIPSLPEN